MTIRRYAEADHDAVFALHNLALDAAGAHAGNGPWDDDLHHVREVYLEAGGEFLVGEVDGQIVAMGALRRLGPDRGAITRMRVHPDHQRRGYGRSILEQLEECAAALGIGELTLDTTVGQTAAQGLYEGMGYAETGRTASHGFRVILYEKRL